MTKSNGRTADATRYAWGTALTATAILTLIGVRTGWADQIRAGSDNYPRGSIVGYSDGQVKFQTPDLKPHLVSIAAVDQMFVDSEPTLRDLNDAEEFRSRGEPAQAALRYERALRTAPGFWQDLVRVRLLRAHDEAGQFGPAVTDFIHVARNAPVLAAELIPASIPDSASPETRQAVMNIDAALKRDRGTDAEPVLQLLRYAIVRRVDPKAAADMALTVAMLRVPARMEEMDPAPYSLQLDAVRLLLDEARYDDVVAGSASALDSAPDTVAPDLLLLQGRAMFASAEKKADREALLDSGLAFMRVVVHFEDDARAGDALLWAARVHEKIERPSRAVQLARECLERTDLSDETRADADALLKRLTGA